MLWILNIAGLVLITTGLALMLMRRNMHLHYSLVTTGYLALGVGDFIQDKPAWGGVSLGLAAALCALWVRDTRKARKAETAG